MSERLAYELRHLPTFESKHINHPHVSLKINHSYFTISSEYN